MTYGANDGLRQIVNMSKGHLSVERTQASQYDYKPWLMDFENAPEQTFGHENCTRERNYLIVPPTQQSGENNQ